MGRGPRLNHHGTTALTHAPATQIFMPGQSRPQVPQFKPSVSVLVQTPLQSEWPALQTEPHMPFVHSAVAFAGVGQALLHVPQWIRLERTSTQPPGQATAGATHSTPQFPPLQIGRAFGAPAQTVPHPPQFDVSVAVTTHEPLHSMVPAEHPPLHTPPAHTVPGAQVRSHVPQCAPSVWRLTQSSSHAV